MKGEFGFWRSLRRLRGEDILSVELLVGLVLGVGGGLAVLAQTSLPGRLSTAGDFLIVIGPLLGVVVAAFALVVSLFSDTYIRALNENPDGVSAFLRPFLVAIGIQVAALLLAVAYRASASHLSTSVEGTAFVVLSFLFTYAVADVVALARGILAHGVTRAKDVRVRDLEAKAQVLRHPGQKEGQGGG
jgi:small-conductance mechanosensitive channel